MFRAIFCLKHVDLISEINKSLFHLVGSSILLYLIDDARSNKNQDVYKVYLMSASTQMRHSPSIQPALSNTAGSVSAPVPTMRLKTYIRPICTRRNNIINYITVKLHTYIKQATSSKTHILMKNNWTLIVPDYMGMLRYNSITCQNRKTLRYAANKTVKRFNDVTAAETSCKRRQLNTCKRVANTLPNSIMCKRTSGQQISHAAL